MALTDIRQIYDPTYDAWPELERGRVVLAPVRVGVDRRTGRMIVGWKHVVQSLGVIFATPFHVRVLRRWVGSFVPLLLGESTVPRVVTRFYWAIMSAVDLWEPNYSIQRVRIDHRADGSALTSPEELRLGGLVTKNDGVYRPRGHLGDMTPDARRSLGLIGRGHGAWEEAR